MAAIRVVKPGLLTTIQDRGRSGYGHLGVPQGGALDGYAMRWAQRLAGCAAVDAVLEITLLGPTLAVLGDTYAGLAGADLGALVNGDGWPAGTGRSLRSGDVISFTGPKEGLRAYLAFAGGVSGDLVLGSRATDIQSRVGGLAGRALRANDEIVVGEGGGSPVQAPVPTLRGGERVRILPGPRHDQFPKDAIPTLTATRYRVTTQSDRVGMRLEGLPVPNASGSNISEGVPIGAIEIPPSAQPIVLLHGRGTVGGYPVIATVITADLPVLAQLRPGGALRFEVVDAREARLALEDLCGEFALPVLPAVAGESRN